MIGKCVWIIYGNLCFISFSCLKSLALVDSHCLPKDSKHFCTMTLTEHMNENAEMTCVFFHNVFYRIQSLNPHLQYADQTRNGEDSLCILSLQNMFPLENMLHCAVGQSLSGELQKNHIFIGGFCWLELPDCNEVVLKGTSKPRLLPSWPPGPNINY